MLLQNVMSQASEQVAEHVAGGAHSDSLSVIDRLLFFGINKHDRLITFSQFCGGGASKNSSTVRQLAFW